MDNYFEGGFSMKNLFLVVCVALITVVTYGQEQEKGQGQQQEPNPGAILFGDWTTSLRQTDSRSDIRLEMSFFEGTMELKAICEYDGVVHLEAVTRVPVRYYNEHIRVLQRGYAQSRQGPFYCESAINPQIMAYFPERANGDIIRLLFADRREPIYLFKKMESNLK